MVVDENSELRICSKGLRTAGGTPWGRDGSTHHNSGSCCLPCSFTHVFPKLSLCTCREQALRVTG